MRAQSRIEGIRGALRFFSAHTCSVETGHSDEAALKIDSIPDAATRNSVLYLGRIALAMYEGIALYLGESLQRPESAEA